MEPFPGVEPGGHSIPRNGGRRSEGHELAGLESNQRPRTVQATSASFRELDSNPHNGGQSAVSYRLNDPGVDYNYVCQDPQAFFVMRMPSEVW